MHRRFDPAPTARRACLALLLALAACAPFPDLTAVAPGVDAPPPALLPIDQVLAAGKIGQLSASSGTALAARAGNLQQRAAAMRGPLLDPATRERLAQAGNR